MDLSSNTSGLNGGLGQYAVGTFTVISPELLVLQLNGQSRGLPNINALQIRAVPEPSTWVLGGGRPRLCLVESVAAEADRSMSD